MDASISIQQKPVKPLNVTQKPAIKDTQKNAGMGIPADFRQDVYIIIQRTQITQINIKMKLRV